MTSESKGAKISELVRRPKGATLAEIMKATDWTTHSVRGFLSAAGKKSGLNLASSKNNAGERMYQIKKWREISTRVEAAAREGWRLFYGVALELCRFQLLYAL